MPRCYEWRKWYIEYGKCHPDVNCPLREDEDRLRKGFNYINRIIYTYRSMFAHKARTPPFSTDDDILHVTDIYKGDLILIEFTLGDFEEIVDNVLKRYFDGLPKKN